MPKTDTSKERPASGAPGIESTAPTPGEMKRAKDAERKASLVMAGVLAVAVVGFALWAIAW